MPTPTAFKMFPKEHVWIPTTDGKFCQRPVTSLDEKRRDLVRALLSRPLLPRGKRLSREEELALTESKIQIRKRLALLPAPYESQDTEDT